MSDQQRYRFQRLTLQACLAACFASPAFSQSPSDFETPEFYANWGLNVIGAQYAYAMGYTGKGVKLGIADDAFQFTHPEYAGRIFYPVTFPTFPIPGAPIPDHGTHVMGLAGASRNNVGMMGVAFDASLLGVAAYNSDGYPPPGDWVQTLISEGVSVMNGSFGPDAMPAPYLDPDTPNPNYRVVDYQIFTTAQMQESLDTVSRLSAADIVMVFAAGNEFNEQPLAARIPSGLPMLPLINPSNTAAGHLYRVVTQESDPNNPNTWTYIPITDPYIANFDASAYLGTLIAVVATDQNNKIASLSNRCGATAAWCIAAPGINLWSTVPMNTYELMSGTSMAAPLVAGSAAVLRQAFPYMTARQIIEVLLTTATDLGDPDTYGHGMLNLAAAVRGPIEFGSNPIFANTFTVDTQGYNSTWSNNIAGAGGLSKSGAGELILTGQNTYTGNTSIWDGTLRVNGSIIQSNLLIDTPAILKGAGTIGNTVIKGIMAPGNSVGTLHVQGDLQFANGGTLEIEIENSTLADAVIVSGDVTLDPGAGLRLQVMDRVTLDYNYPIIQASNVFGTFTELSPEFLFINQVLTPNTVGATTSLDLTLTRNTTAFASYATSPNQAAVANAIDSQQSGDEPFDALVLSTSPSGLASDYQMLSGEIYANNQAVLLTQSRLLMQTILKRTQDSQQNPDGIGLRSNQAQINEQTTAWIDVYGDRTALSGQQGRDSIQANGSGVMIGIDHAITNNTRFGGSFGVMQTQANSTNSHANTQTYQLALYGTSSLNAFTLSAGLAQSWHEVQSNRTLPLGIDPMRTNPTASAKVNGYSTQLFADLGMKLPVTANTWLEPFVNLNQVWLYMDSFTESGSAAALRGQSSQTNSLFSTLGLRSNTSWMHNHTRWQLDAMAGWQRTWGDRHAANTLQFQAGNPFTVTSNPLARDAVALELGIAAKLSKSSQLRIAYSGLFGQGTRMQTLQAQLNWNF